MALVVERPLAGNPSRHRLQNVQLILDPSHSLRPARQHGRRRCRDHWLQPRNRQVCLVLLRQPLCDCSSYAGCVGRYSCLNVVIGSIFVARLAGASMASKAAATNSAGALTKTIGSHTLTSNSGLLAIRARAENTAVVSASPSANPTATGRPLAPSTAR